MLRARIIPVLLLNQGGLYKTVSFKKPRYIGDPVNAVRIFNEKEVDELILLDINASKTRTGPDYNLIETVANETFMPFAYGGGVTCFEQAQKIYKLGAEKIIIGQAAFSSPELIKKISDHYGAQAIILSVNVIKTFLGHYRIFDPAHLKKTSIDPIQWVRDRIPYGIGEIFLTSVHYEGQKNGYDIDLVKTFSDCFDCPIIAHGGAGDLSDIKKVIEKGGATAAAAGSLFVYHGHRDAVLINYPSYQNLCTLLN